MTLVAGKTFIDGGRRYNPGDPCDEALGWRYTALRACLNEGIILDPDGDVERMLRGEPPVRHAARDGGTSQRPHKCSVCHRGFRNRGSLASHMKIHKGAAGA